MSADQFIEIIIIGSWGWRKRLWVAAWGMMAKPQQIDQNKRKKPNLIGVPLTHIFKMC
jgi:hypothetical protein